MLPVERTELKPKTWTALLALVLSAVIIFSASKAKMPILYVVGGLTALASLLLLWFLKKSKLVIDDQGITSITKMSTRAFAWKDINHTYVSEHFNGKRRIAYWNFETADKNKLSIPLSHYSKQDLRTIAHAVASKCGHAEKDARVALMML
jgi:hypothetical protein